MQRHAVERAVDRRRLERWRRDSLGPAVLRGIVVERQQETGVRQHPGIAGTGIIENDVRTGAGGDGRVDRLPHLVGAEWLPATMVMFGFCSMNAA